MGLGSGGVLESANYGQIGILGALEGPPGVVLQMPHSLKHLV